MFVDDLVPRFAWRLGSPVARNRGCITPPRDPAATYDTADPPLRPAADLETRLALRSLGWRP